MRPAAPHICAPLPRLDALLAEGVTTVEVKSGYGLTVEDELKNHDGLTSAQYDQGGLKVVTTINKTAQNAAVTSEQDLSGEDHGSPESSLVSVKPGDGAVEAMYAGHGIDVPPLRLVADGVQR